MVNGQWSIIRLGPVNQGSINSCETFRKRECLSGIIIQELVKYYKTLLN